MPFSTNNWLIVFLELCAIQTALSFSPLCTNKTTCAIMDHFDESGNHIFDQNTCKHQTEERYYTFTDTTSASDIKPGLYICNGTDDRIFHLRKIDIIATVELTLYPNFDIYNVIDREYTLVLSALTFGFSTTVLEQEWLPHVKSESDEHQLLLNQKYINIQEGHNGGVEILNNEEPYFFELSKNKRTVYIKSHFCGLYVLRGKSLTRTFERRINLNEKMCLHNFEYYWDSDKSNDRNYPGYCDFFDKSLYHFNFSANIRCWITGHNKPYFTSTYMPNHDAWKFKCINKTIPDDYTRKWRWIHFLCRSPDPGAPTASAYDPLPTKFVDEVIVVHPNQSVYDPAMQNITIEICSGFFCNKTLSLITEITDRNGEVLTTNHSTNISLSGYTCISSVIIRSRFETQSLWYLKIINLKPVQSPECLSFDMDINNDMAQKSIHLCVPKLKNMKERFKNEKTYIHIMGGTVCTSDYFEISINGAYVNIHFDVKHEDIAKISCKQYSCSWKVGLILRSRIFKKIKFLEPGIFLTPEKKSYEPLFDVIKLIVYTKFELRSTGLDSWVLSPVGKLLDSGIDNTVVVKNYVCLSTIQISSMFMFGFTVFNRTIILDPMLNPKCVNAKITMTTSKAQTPFRLCYSNVLEMKQYMITDENYNRMIRGVECTTQYKHITISKGKAIVHLQVQHAHDAVIYCELNDCNWTVRVVFRSAWFAKYNKEMLRCGEKSIRNQIHPVYSLPIVLPCILLVFLITFTCKLFRKRLSNEHLQHNNAASIIFNLNEEDMDILHMILLNKNSSHETIQSIYTQCLELHSKENNSDLEIFLQNIASRNSENVVNSKNEYLDANRPSV